MNVNTAAPITPGEQKRLRSALRTIADILGEKDLSERFAAATSSDPFLPLSYFAEQLGKSEKYLHHISEAQRGLLWVKGKDGRKRTRFTQRALRSYPTFVKGPGGALGLYASQYRAWREEQNAPIEVAL